MKKILKEWRMFLESSENDSGSIEDTGTEHEDIVSDTAEPEFIMPIDLYWVDYGTRFVHLTIDEVMEIEGDLPVYPATAAERRSEFESDKWRLRELYIYVFGNMGQHGYSNNSATPFETHPDKGKLMLPPSWTLAMSTLINKTDVAKFKINNYVDIVDGEPIINDEEALIDAAGSYGYLGDRGDEFKGVRELQAHINRMENIDVMYF
jgi:hypothetical protein